MIIKAALSDFAKHHDAVFLSDRTKTVGASEIGLCERRVWYAKHGQPKDQEDTWGARLRGSTIENAFWEPAVRAKFGANFIASGRNQNTIEDECLSATPDGILINQPKDFLSPFGIPDMGATCVVVESKSIDPRVNLREAKSENQFQVQVQLGLIRRKTKYHPNYALISYVDASFWDEVKEFPIAYDDTIYQAAQLRAKKIINATSVRETVPEGYVGGGKACEYCPFRKSCGVELRTPPGANAAADPQFVAEITDLCQEAQSIKEQRDALEADLKAAQVKIRERLKDKGVRKIDGVVSWSPVKGRTSYDMEGLEAAATARGVDVGQFERVGEPSDRLQIMV